MNTSASALPSPNPALLEAWRARFVAEMRSQQAAGMTRSAFQTKVWDWAVQKEMIYNGVPWLSAERAAEAFDNPRVFAYDLESHPQGLLTAMDLFGHKVTLLDHQTVVATWMQERSRRGR